MQKEINAEKLYNPEPANVRRLIDAAMEMRVCMQLDIARRLGVTDRAMRLWVAGSTNMPYTAQVTLEILGERK